MTLQNQSILSETLHIKKIEELEDNITDLQDKKKEESKPPILKVLSFVMR